MNKVIASGKINNLVEISEEEFVEFIKESNPEGLFERIANEHDNINSIVKIGLSLLDPTGIYDSITSVLDSNVAGRERDMLARAVYRLGLMIEKNKVTLDIMIKDRRVEYEYLISRYLELSRKEIQVEKINYLKDLTLNSFMDIKIKVDERKYMLELLSELNHEQLMILAYMVKERPVDDITNIDFNNMYTVPIQDYADLRELDYSFVKQYCTDLHARGLLGVVVGLNITADIRAFLPTEFTYKFLSYFENDSANE